MDYLLIILRNIGRLYQQSTVKHGAMKKPKHELLFQVILSVYNRW